MRFPKIPVLITSIITIAIIIVNHFLDGNFWNGWKLESSMVLGCFCEHNYMERFIRQPFNTWSNIAFLYAGILILYQTFKNDSENINYITRQKIIGTFFGILLCILFAGSFLFHASLTTFFGITDMIGTYGIPLFLSMIGLSRIFVYHNILQEKAAGIIGVLITYTLGFALAVKWIIFINMIVTFASLLLLAGIAGLYLSLRKDIHFNKKLLVINCILIFLACTLWIIDHYLICFEYSIFQGHSIWHVLNAMAAYFMFQFFRSEHA